MTGVVVGPSGDPIVEDGVVAGNVFDKYGSSSPMVRAIMRGFFRSFDQLLVRSGCAEIHEVGCGEGSLARRLARQGLIIRASDFSPKIIAAAREMSSEERVEVSFGVRSIFELDPAEDSAPLIVCSEVLEHLEEPERALESIAAIARPFLLASVPREPIWRTLNLARGKYLGSLGNTPGHVQHWSRRGFLALLREHFDVVESVTPLPWTMALCKVR